MVLDTRLPNVSSHMHSCVEKTGEALEIVLGQWDYKINVSLRLPASALIYKLSILTPPAY